MAISFVAAADIGNNGGTTNSLSANYSCGSGLNRLLVVCINGDKTVDDVTGVTYAGTSMTFAVKNLAAGMDRHQYIYFLLSPASGTNSVVISCTSTHYLLAGAADYSGVAQSGQPDATTTNVAGSSSNTSLTTSITTIADNSWAILMETDYDLNSDNLPPVASTGDTRRAFDGPFGGWGMFDSNGPVTPAGSYSLTTTRGTTPQYPIGHSVTSFAPDVQLLHSAAWM